MKLLYPIFLYLLLTQTLTAQYAIGHKTITFSDPSRNNRQIQTEIYYPSDVAGDNQPVATGTFPVISFGHGFVMAVSAYQNVREVLVPAGYIVCFPTTEGSFSPNHTAFAQDLAFLCPAMEAENSMANSLFFNHVEAKYGVIGHSMGGGCAILAQQYAPTYIDAVAAFAPANTTPSAISAAAGVMKPSLLFSGTYDCITPADQHAYPIFQALDPELCKLYISITGGSHCQFGNANTACSFGESASGCGSPPISRNAQQAIVNSILLPWLDHYLKNDATAWITLSDVLHDETGFMPNHQCASSSVSGGNAEKILRLSPNPVTDEINLDLQGFGNDGKLEVLVTEMMGRTIYSSQIEVQNGQASARIQVQPGSAGLYICKITDKSGHFIVRKFVKE